MKNRFDVLDRDDPRFGGKQFERERLHLSARTTSRPFMPFVQWPLKALRYLVYFVLLFLRIPVLVVTRLAVWPLVLGGLFWGCVKGWTSMPAPLLLGVGLGLFVLGYLYDSLLLLLAPEPITLYT